MRRIKWFVPASDDHPYNAFGVADLRAATLYSRQDGFTAPAGSPAESPAESPDELARRNQAFWEATQRPTGCWARGWRCATSFTNSKGLLHTLLRRRRNHG
ncbi:hypothetical protein [Micromonospora profundi]|uniref:hypothetical protein n=1 Tax=Micromonospora profundi TaxID=1420889 RepID=UPI0036831882